MDVTSLAKGKATRDSTIAADSMSLVVSLMGTSYGYGRCQGPDGASTENNAAVVFSFTCREYGDFHRRCQFDGSRQISAMARQPWVERLFEVRLIGWW